LLRGGSSRAHIIRELRNTPSYKLHETLETWYKKEFSSQDLQSRQYLDVYYWDDRKRMRRTITIVEDLSWDALPGVDVSRLEKGDAPLDNTSSTRHNSPSPLPTNPTARESSGL
jgi:hypothetical protein